MSNRLVDIPAGKLLEKFGSGNHKPGSGSAAALQGLLAAQLIRTVISLTKDPKRTEYQIHVDRLVEIEADIERRIYPELEYLFQYDSDQFDKTIKIRSERDLEHDLQRKKLLAQQALSALKVSTETPLKIADHCVTLAEYASFIFKNGFKSARGDAGVALNNAVAAIAGCVAIVNLNLLSFSENTWTVSIRSNVEKLRLRHIEFLSDVEESLTILEVEAKQLIAFDNSVKSLTSRTKANSQTLNSSDIEKIATDLQNVLWVHRKLIWKKNTPTHPIEVLRPEIAVKKNLQYAFESTNSLGFYEVNGTFFEVAGIIDNRHKKVSISNNFPETTKNFTTAHELGHALLHDQPVLHRDRAIDGSHNSGRTLTEQQADKFAAYFLMPKKQVLQLFQEIFFTEKFIINEDSVFALNGRSVSTFREKCKNLRGLCRVLASSEYFSGSSFKSMAETFQVSVETMAIRLEELELVKY